MQNICRVIVVIVLCSLLAGCSFKDLERTQNEVITGASSTIDQVSQQAQNLASSQEVRKFTDDFIAFIPKIEATGIKIDNIYIDSIPFLLIFEVKLEQIDRQKLDKLISKEPQLEQHLLTMLELLRTLVNKARTQNLGSFNMDRVQLRLSIHPPFVSTRIKYIRNNK